MKYKNLSGSPSEQCDVSVISWNTISPHSRSETPPPPPPPTQYVVTLLCWLLRHFDTLIYDSSDYLTLAQSGTYERVFSQKGDHKWVIPCTGTLSIAEQVRAPCTLSNNFHILTKSAEQCKQLARFLSKMVLSEVGQRPVSDVSRPAQYQGACV